MKIKIMIFLLLSSTLYAKGPKTYGSFRVSEVVSIIDGDTIKVTIHNIHPLIGERIPVRLAGIDAPELSSTNRRVKALALEAKAFTTEAIEHARDIRLDNVRRDKYFRILADVVIDGKNLGKMLIEAGLALPYHGGSKPTRQSRKRGGQ